MPWGWVDLDHLNASSPLFAEWKNERTHYDNVFQSMLSLFVVATLEGWPSLMYAAMDAPAESGNAPQRNAHPHNAVFYVIFVIIGSFFVMNIFVGVVVHKFQVAKERTDGRSIYLTDAQKDFVDRVKFLLDSGQPKRLTVPHAHWRQRIFYLVLSVPRGRAELFPSRTRPISAEHPRRLPRGAAATRLCGCPHVTALPGTLRALRHGRDYSQHDCHLVKSLRPERGVAPRGLVF